ncbi:uncharacterized protein CLUP02_12727 [Colletotrichum lupini]|uniref:AT hook domain-containing protein n=1 Tax=Colletotrichum lupini TaxID=145971 RepID=A0A9Q8T1G6_9PEZI|nr:uncharacterized protein CLUP02_12727 [Colletotrichum lupini]UQC87225.1 hypothetical protein CLUP02_12727 [Colletotrichum lupini]
MPRYLDRLQLGRALRDHANPLLEALAANDNLHAHYLKRFESDEPPQYNSDTSSEYDEDDAPAEDPRELIERPLDDDDIKWIAFAMGPQITPGQLYRAEAKREEKRIWDQCPGPVFYKPKGIRRQAIVVRHNMKKHWEKLGIWNPAWGFAGRNVQPNDDPSKWRWKWEQENGQDTDGQRVQEDLITCTLLSRKDLRRGEHVPVEPQPSLVEGATAHEAESFLTSRPWFLYKLEVTEEKQRADRVSFKDQYKLPQGSCVDHVIERWKARGDWKDQYDEDGVTSWRWGHESPSPEPEVLTPMQNMRESDSLDASVMDFTPSELDELEVNELPWDEQPETYWVTPKGMERMPGFPGEMPKSHSADYSSPQMHISRSARTEALGSRKEGPEKRGARNRLSADASAEKPPEPREPALSHPPQKARRGRPRRTQNETTITHDHDKSSFAPRRSARIAGTKRSAESATTEAAPSKRSRGRKPSDAGHPTGSESMPTKKRSAPIRLPAGEETKAAPKRGRGRPKMEAPEPAPTKKTIKGQPGQARGRGRSSKKGSEPEPLQESPPKRGRGRPRKENPAAMHSSISKKK